MMAHWVTTDGWSVQLRHIDAADEPLWLEFMRNLSTPTRYKRGARRSDQLTPEVVRRAVMPDPAREFVIVAVAQRGEARQFAGVARCSFHEHGECEFALVIADQWQRRRVGQRLMNALVEEAARRERRSVYGVVLATNRGMLDFAERLGFAVEDSERGPMFKRVVRSVADRP